MRAELLVGGSYQSKKSRRRAAARQDELPPVPKVGLKFLAPLILCGAAFVALGAWRVHTVQAHRDYQMESARLQQLILQQRDRTKVLSARLSELQRGEHLRAAAMGGLGMVEPPASQISSLELSAESVARWRMAAAVASEHFPGKEESP